MGQQPQNQIPDTRHEVGQAMVEYGLILGGVGLVIIAVLMLVGPWIASVFDQILTVLG